MIVIVLVIVIILPIVLIIIVILIVIVIVIVTVMVMVMREDTARIARADQWKPTERLCKRAWRIFAGFGQEQITEEAIREMKDDQKRISSKNETKEWRVYDAGHRKQLIPKFGRTEVEPVALQDIPVHANPRGEG